MSRWRAPTRSSSPPNGPDGRPGTVAHAGLRPATSQPSWHHRTGSRDGSRFFFGGSPGSPQEAGPSTEYAASPRAAFATRAANNEDSPYERSRTARNPAIKGNGTPCRSEGVGRCPSTATPATPRVSSQAERYSAGAGMGAGAESRDQMAITMPTCRPPRRSSQARGCGSVGGGSLQGWGAIARQGWDLPRPTGQQDTTARHSRCDLVPRFRCIRNAPSSEPPLRSG